MCYINAQKLPHKIQALHLLNTYSSSKPPTPCSYITPTQLHNQNKTHHTVEGALEPLKWLRIERSLLVDMNPNDMYMGVKWFVHHFWLGHRRTTFGYDGVEFHNINAILLVSTPLLLLFSPIIFFAGLVLVGAVAGFSVAALMAMSGLSTLEWVFHQVKGRRDVGFGEGSTVRERGKDWAGYLQENYPYNDRNRGWKEQGGGI